MKEAIKDKWVKALRSGKYKQGREALHIGDRYCCLGVLCDLHREETGELEWVAEQGPRFHYGNSATVTPDLVVIWAGIGRPEGWSPHLAKMNDNGSSFDEIADEIEANWEEI